MKIPSSLRFTANPDVASSVHDNGIVLLHLANGHIFTSNAIGARIWREVVERQPLDVVVNGISKEYQISRTVICAHVEAFLVELERQTLIEREIEL